MTDEFRLVPELDDNGQETGYYTREPDGVSGMTVTALANLCSVTQPAITQLLGRIQNSDPITNDLPNRLKPFVGIDLRVITNDAEGRLLIPDEACWAILGYYAFDAREYAGKAIAQQSYDRIGGAGMRLFIWTRTGFVPSHLRSSLKSSTTVYIERLENIRDHRVPDDKWTTFREGAEVLLLVEKEFQVPVDQMDLCDGSIGLRWSAYRKDKPWAKPVGSYTHIFRDQRGEREATAYDLSELPIFRKWLRDEYIPLYLPEYLAEKYGKRACREIYDAIGGVTERVEEVCAIKRMTEKQQQLYDDFKKLRARLLAPGDSPQSFIE